MTIGVLAVPSSYAMDTLVACTPLALANLRHEDLGFPPHHSLYGLPEVTACQTVLVHSEWLRLLRQSGWNTVERILEPLRSRHGCIIGIDGADPFQLAFSDSEMTSMDSVIKVSGVYKDLDLYNYVVGSPTPNGCWTEKDEPTGAPYSAVNLAKLHLSMPCFLSLAPSIRARVRKFYVKRPVMRTMRNLAESGLQSPFPGKFAKPKHTAHFVASLTHIQRKSGVEKMQESGTDWLGGITSVPQVVTGFHGNQMSSLTDQERNGLREELEASGLWARRQNRLQYHLGMLSCKAVVSITGYGEICFRMAEAFAARRVLVCQDLSHVHCLFPFQNGHNVVFCRPDLSDLGEILQDIESHYGRYLSIAEQGHADWKDWCIRAEDVVARAFRPVLNAAG